jgi:hypothetical protein
MMLFNNFHRPLFVVIYVLHFLFSNNIKIYKKKQKVSGSKIGGIFDKKTE